MECSIGIDAVDQGTGDIADALQPYLERLSTQLSKDYGGSMEHLWITLEMCPTHADRRAPWSFRFQKRVSLTNEAKRLGLPIAPDAVDPKNVGHFGVRPDYFELAKVKLEDVAAYLLDLVYREAVVLEKKSGRLGGFDAKAFRRDMLTYINENWPSRKQT
jgi:hypothetical protein